MTMLIFDIIPTIKLANFSRDVKATITITIITIIVIIIIIITMIIMKYYQDVVCYQVLKLNVEF